MKLSALDLSIDIIKPFCQKWQITEFSLFGSVLRDDFRPDSDLDVLVSFFLTPPEQSLILSPCSKSYSKL
jgi:predicted nucleotidyltransferase